MSLPTVTAASRVSSESSMVCTLAFTLEGNERNLPGTRAIEHGPSIRHALRRSWLRPRRDVRHRIGSHSEEVSLREQEPGSDEAGSGRSREGAYRVVKGGVCRLQRMAEGCNGREVRERDADGCSKPTERWCERHGGGRGGSGGGSSWARSACEDPAFGRWLLRMVEQR